MSLKDQSELDETIAVLRPMTPARIEAVDRRRAAIHEAGHIVMGRLMGVKVFGAWIHHNVVRDAGLERTWVGSTSFADGAPARSLALMGVAGMVAEAVWHRENVEGLIDRTDDASCMSESDWGMVTRCERQGFEGLVREAYFLLDRNGGVLWKPLLIEARGLMRVAAQVSSAGKQ